MLNVNESAAFIKPCYKMPCFAPIIWRYAESPYLCSVKLRKECNLLEMSVG